MSGHHILIRIPKRSERFSQPIILRRCCDRLMLEVAEFRVSLKDLYQNWRAAGCDFCDVISIELASFVDIATHRFLKLIRILDEFDRFSFASQPALHFVEITFRPENCNLVQQKYWFCFFCDAAQNALLLRSPNPDHAPGGWLRPPTPDPIPSWPKIGRVWDPDLSKLGRNGQPPATTRNQRPETSD